MSQLKIKDNGSWVSIPAGGVGVPSGGTTGQVLTKSSGTDYATQWTTPISTTLLWTNPSPSSDFAAQTISLDLSNYDAVLFVYLLATETAHIGTIIAFKDESNFAGSNNLSSPSSRTGKYRWVTPTDSGVTVGGGATTTGAADNTLIIPYKIYGIKGI